MHQEFIVSRNFVVALSTYISMDGWMDEDDSGHISHKKAPLLASFCQGILIIFIPMASQYSAFD
jgi:hypothetical protein